MGSDPIYYRWRSRFRLALVAHAMAGRFEAELAAWMHSRDVRWTRRLLRIRWRVAEFFTGLNMTKVIVRASCCREKGWPRDDVESPASA